ncbi:hypothetical protein KFU94_44260 [Chloroflexi bacterium TSY]|nr:hypothetical protein [Chloroflexi bacterium TSY]
MLEDWRTAPIDEKLRTTLAFLEKLAVPNGQVDFTDIEKMRNAGVTDQAIEEAIYVCFLFNIWDRLADAFDFDPGTPEYIDKATHYMLKFGYGWVSLPG